MNQNIYEKLISAPLPSKNFELLLNNLNDVGRFFEAYPEEDAVREIAAHIQNYMPPSMRMQIVTHLKYGGIGMKIVVQRAVGRLKEAN